MNFNFAAFLLAAATASSFGANAENAAPATNLRGQQQRELQSNGFHEWLGGRCHGAICSMWGDPHMVTCDGLAYDCQGIGIFTLMDNHMFNIQGNFVDVGDREHVLIEGWGLTHGASITNDIMVEYKQNDDVPILQFGFGDLSGYEETPPSEEGCETWTTFNPVDMGHANDGARTCEASLEDCRARCDENPLCTQFSYWADCGCHLNNDDAVMTPSNPHWPRALAGTTDSTCGVPEEVDITLVGSSGEEEKHGEISQKCPLLMYVDGELQDLSGLDPGQATQVLYGEYNGDVYVTLTHNNNVNIEYKTDTGDVARMELHRTGDGPGELWSCHWNYYVCLPATQQQLFEETTLGLLGTPNGNQQDDWMTPDGTTLPLEHTGADRHENMHEYCVDNWCVSQEDSIMTYHGDTTYADHKCEQEDHIDWHDDENCVLSGDQIYLACRDQPPHIRYACELDCCLGGCGTIEEVTEDVIDVIRNEEESPSTNFEYDGDEACVKDELEDTSSTICPGGDDLVKLLKTTGDTPLSEDDDIFYDISFGEDDTVTFKINNPFGAAANVFVKHDKPATVSGFLDPVCEGEELRPVDCNNDFEVTVACLDYPDVEPFALVNVYFASVAVSPLNDQATIDRCCDPDEYAPAVGVVEYTFEIPCGCPGVTPQ